MKVKNNQKVKEVTNTNGVQKENKSNTPQGKKKNKNQNAGKGNPKQVSPDKNAANNKGKKGNKTEAKAAQVSPAANGVNNKRKSPGDQPQNLEGSKKKRKNKKNAAEKGTNVTDQKKPAPAQKQENAQRKRMKPKRSITAKKNANIQYLDSWKSKKAKWEFNTGCHLSLSNHAFNFKTLPDSHFPILVEYLKETKDRCPEKIAERKEEAKDFLERAKKLLKLF